MTLAGRPLRCMALLIGLWVTGRMVWLWPAAAAEEPMAAEPVLASVPPAQMSPLPPMSGEAAPLAVRTGPAARDRPARATAAPAFATGVYRNHAEEPGTASGGFAGIALMGLGVLGFAPTQTLAPTGSSSRLPSGQPQPAPRGTNRLSASAWLFGRSAMSAPPLATGGQLGGSQFGARLVYRVAGTPAQPLSAFARLSGPVSQRGRELALGMEVQPLSRLPVRLAVERRIALEQGAASGVAISAIGGGSVALPHGLQLDAYGQAGVVGLKRRDPFVDGAAVVTRQVAQLRNVPVRIGAGVWGGAQPGVSRLDVGPRVEAGVPMAGQVVRLGLDWRERVLGNAEPGSGPAVTLGADF